MNERCDVVLFSCRQTRQNGALYIVNNESMPVTSEIIASVGVVHASIGNTGVLEKNLNTVDGSDVVFDSMLCTPDLKLAHVDFRCETGFFVVPCPAHVGCLLFDEMSHLAVSAAMSRRMRSVKEMLPSWTPIFAHALFYRRV